MSSIVSMGRGGTGKTSFIALLTKYFIETDETPVLLVDADPDEEKVTDARLTVASLADGTLCALQKGGNYPITSEDVMKMADIGVEKAKELRKLVK